MYNRSQIGFIRMIRISAYVPPTAPMRAIENVSAGVQIWIALLFKYTLYIIINLLFFS